MIDNSFATPGNLMNDNGTLPTTQFGNYAVESVLAANDFSHRYTYKCRDLTGNAVVLKEFRFGSNKSWSPYLLVEKEIDILKTLDHDRIPKYIEKIETPTSICFVQEYIEGEALGSKGWTEAQVVEMLDRMLDILIYLQQNQIIHGDIKPDNILFQEDRYCLVDFGLTKVLKEEKSSTTIGGTTEFMPPEVMLGRGLNYTSDVYSLAKTALKLLSPSATVNFDFSVDLSGIEGSLRKWLKKALKPNPGDRYPNAKVAKEGLVDCLEPEPVLMSVEPSHSDIDRPAEGSLGEGIVWIVAGSASAIAAPKIMAAILETPPGSPASPFPKEVDTLLSVAQPLVFLTGMLAVVTGFWKLVVGWQRGDCP